MIKKSLIFLEKTPFMGVELLDIVKNYSLVSYIKDSCLDMLSESNYRVLSFNSLRMDREIDSDKAVVRMLSNDKWIKHIFNTPNVLALFFYMNKKIDILCTKHEIKMALPPYQLQEMLGNKLLIGPICTFLNIKTNPSIQLELEKNLHAQYNTCVRLFGSPFIIQGENGVSGEDTCRIESFANYYRCMTKIKKGRASKYLANTIPLSMHICITENKIYLEGPFLQILGFRELASNPFKFSGNDMNQKLIPNEVINTTMSMAKIIATYTKKQGYKGIMGIDFLWDLENNNVYPQEINSRFVGLTRLITGVQKEQNVIPDLIRHINEFTSATIVHKFNNKKMNIVGKYYSQIYISNNLLRDVQVKNYLEPGIYELNKAGLKKVKKSLFIKDMSKDEILVTFSAYNKSAIKPDQIISKIILKKSVISNNYALTDDALCIIDAIKKYILN